MLGKDGLQITACGKQLFRIGAHLPQKYNIYPDEWLRWEWIHGFPNNTDYKEENEKG